MGVQTIGPSFAKNLKEPQLQTIGHSFGGESTIGFKLLDPHLGECNGSPNYWAFIWGKDKRGVQSLNYWAFIWGEDKRGVQSLKLLGLHLGGRQKGSVQSPNYWALKLGIGGKFGSYSGRGGGGGGQGGSTCPTQIPR
jgi:hypothetical protein